MVGFREAGFRAAGFLVALIARSLDRWMLHDPNGIPPVPIGDGSFDLNAVTVLIAAALLTWAMFLFL